MLSHVDFQTLLSSLIHTKNGVINFFLKRFGIPLYNIYTNLYKYKFIYKFVLNKLTMTPSYLKLSKKSMIIKKRLNIGI